MSKVFNMVGGGGKNISSIIITGLLSTDTVTCTKDGKSYTAIWDETDQQWEFVGLPTGTFTLTATSGINTSTETVLIDIVGVYEITMDIPYYGDGSLNTVKDGYNSKLLLNGKNWNPSTTTYSSGNINVIYNLFSNVLKSASSSTRNRISKVKSGTNSYSVRWDASKKDLSIAFEIFGLYNGFDGSTYLSNLKLTCDGVQKTLSELVSSGYIKPMVLIANGNNENWIFPSPLNMYTGGSSGETKYGGLEFYFILNKGHIITALSFYSSKSNNDDTVNDGVFEISADKDLFSISMRR